LACVGVVDATWKIRVKNLLGQFLTGGGEDLDTGPAGKNGVDDDDPTRARVGD
jgi:hypothetical protein